MLYLIVFHFIQKLRVESELICANCSKSVCDFHTFYKRVLLSQEKATVRKLKNVFTVPQSTPRRIAPAPQPSAPIETTVVPVDPLAKPLKRIAPAPPPSAAPVEKKMRTADEKGGKLFVLLTTNEFQCKLCRATLASKSVLNDHLFLAHKVKISCKLCKKR